MNYYGRYHRRKTCSGKSRKKYNGRKTVQNLLTKKGKYIKLYRQRNTIIHDLMVSEPPDYCKIDDVSLDKGNQKPFIAKCPKSVQKLDYDIFTRMNCKIRKNERDIDSEEIQSPCAIEREKIEFTTKDIENMTPDFLWSIGVDDTYPEKYSIEFGIGFEFNPDKMNPDTKSGDKSEQLWSVEQLELIEKLFETRKFKNEVLDQVLSFNAFNDADDFDELNVKEYNPHLDMLMKRWIENGELRNKIEIDSAIIDSDSRFGDIGFRFFLKAKVQPKK